MALILLKTNISAPIERVFDLVRSIDAHLMSASQSREKAIDGRTSGLIKEGETVTWEAFHFGIKQRLKVRGTKVNRPYFFKDEMISGAFSSMEHQHWFEEKDGGTEMSDRFEFQAPLGFLGRIAEQIFLTNYMKRFLVTRNGELKKMAESDRWQKYINKPAEPGGSPHSGQRAAPTTM